MFPSEDRHVSVEPVQACHAAIQALGADEAAAGFAPQYQARWALSDCASEVDFNGVLGCLTLAVVGRFARQADCERQALERVIANLEVNCRDFGDEFSCTNQARAECQLGQRSKAVVALERACSRDASSPVCGLLSDLECAVWRVYDDQARPLPLPVVLIRDIKPGAKAPSRPKIQARHRVDEVAGFCKAEDVARVVSTRVSGIQYCYEKELARNPTLVERLKLLWRIGTEGGVDAVRVESASNEKVGGCAARQVERWVFPPPAGGECQIRVAFDFSPPEGAVAPPPAAAETAEAPREPATRFATIDDLARAAVDAIRKKDFEAFERLHGSDADLDPLFPSRDRRGDELRVSRRRAFDELISAVARAKVPLEELKIVKITPKGAEREVDVIVATGRLRFLIRLDAVLRVERGFVVGDRIKWKGAE